MVPVPVPVDGYDRRVILECDSPQGGCYRRGAPPRAPAPSNSPSVRCLPMAPRWQWPEHVCLVGNGPLSAENRKQISQCPFVVRFNDRKSAKPRERTDLLVLRENGVAGYHGRSGDGRFRVLPVVLVENAGRQRAPTPRACVVVERIAHPPTLFGVRTTTANTPWGASTGAVILQHLQEAPSTRVVSTFGMNFSRSDDSRHMHSEGELLRQHVGKMEVHATPSASYLP